MLFRRMLFSVLLVVSGLLLVNIQPAFALCPPGKTSVTVINPAGKAIELCVAESAIDQIGGPTDTVIPAKCPCWTQDEIASFSAETPLTCEIWPGYVKYSIEIPCTMIWCGNQDWTFEIRASEGPAGERCWFPNPNPPPILAIEGPANSCEVWPDGPELSSLSEAEGDACVAILNTFVQ